MPRINYSVIVILLFSVLLTACSSKPKTELERYKEMTNSFAYQSLSVLSKNTINPSLALYQEMKSEDDAEIKPAYVHALASTSFAIIGNSKWALAEANLALDSAEDPVSQYVAYSVFSMALHNKGLTELGDDYALKAKLLEDSDVMSDKYDKNKVVISAILGINAVRNGDGKAAELLFKDIGERRGVEWLPVVAHGTAILVDNPSIFAVKDLTKLMQRDDVSLAAREKLAQLRHIANQHKDAPHEMKSSAGELMQKWTFDSLESVGKFTGEVALDVLVKVVGGLLALGHI